MQSPHFSLRFVGGPLNGRRRNISGCPNELASRVAMPLPRNVSQPRNRLAVYQLRNENGDWSYRHLHTATNEELGVQTHNEASDDWTAV